jgi:hypothetical protein
MTRQTHKWLPEQPTQEMINEVNNVNFFASIYIPDDALADLYKVMWQAAPSVSQKPVAILGHDVPLYTHAHPKCEPLSNEEVQNLFANATYPMGWSDLREFVRMIEKAHGIGETKCI